MSGIVVHAHSRRRLHLIRCSRAAATGIQLTVTLFPDSTFRLRQVYQDRPVAFHNLGRWSVEEKGTRLVLRGGTEAVRLFQIVRRLEYVVGTALIA